MGEDRLKKPYYPDVHLYKAVAQDKRLSLEARGLYVMMMSLPDEWEYSVGGLATVAGCGRDKIRRVVNELEDVGYLLREQNRSSGKFSGNTYVLQSQAPPLSGNPSTVNPDDGKSRQREKPSTGKTVDGKPDTKYYDNNTSNTPYSPPEGEAAQPVEEPKGKRRRKAKAVPEWQAEKFEGFWQAYPRDEDRAKAVEQWDAIPKDKELMQRHGGDEEKLLLEISRGLGRHLACEDWKKGVGIPYAFRWLRDRKWTEKAKNAAPEYRPTAPPRKYTTQIVNGEEVVNFD